MGIRPIESGQNRSLHVAGVNSAGHEGHFGHTEHVCWRLAQLADTEHPKCSVRALPQEAGLRNITPSSLWLGPSGALFNGLNLMG